MPRLHRRDGGVVSYSTYPTEAGRFIPVPKVYKCDTHTKLDSFQSAVLLEANCFVRVVDVRPTY